MTTNKLIATFILGLFFSALSAGMSFGSAHVGSVLSLQGSVNIEREGKTVTPVVNGSVFLQDVVSTAGQSSIKVQFAEGSTMTLGENTKVVIRDFVTDNKQKSFFDLLDGRVHLVTATGNFNVQTPSAIVAAQGGTCAVIEVCPRNQERCVKVIEGGIDVCDTSLAGCKPLPAGTVGEGITGTGKPPGKAPDRDTLPGTDVCWGDYCTHGANVPPSEPAGLCATCAGGASSVSPGRSVGVIDLIWP